MNPYQYRNQYCNYKMNNTKLTLIVEDDKPLQIIYERLLVSMGLEAVVVPDGRQAMAFLQHQTPALIFLDMLLPYVSGVEILDYMASEARVANTHVVIVSSNLEFSRYQHTIASAQFHLKPILPSQIRYIVKHHFKLV